MSTAFSRKRKINPADSVFKLGHCIGPNGSVLNHVPWNPEGTGPVEPLDKDGKWMKGFCRVTATAMADTAKMPKGTTIYCQCPCHGDDIPEAWPGYYESRTGATAEVEDDDEDDEPEEAPSDSPDAPVQAPADDEPEAGTDAPEVADAPTGTETKRIRYPNGFVARMEVPGTDKKGKDVTHVNWVAMNLSGTHIGDPQWSLKQAKELL